MAEVSTHRHLPSGAVQRLGTALAHPIRQTVLLRLAEGSASPGELAILCDTTRPNMSNHLACLRGCGLVEFERHGRRSTYRLASTEMGRALLQLGSIVHAECEVAAS
ncbi:MAG: metalloregulator ArsR/SmtB family transcription factor, partial [Acidimicrobiia bacterium]